MKMYEKRVVAYLIDIFLFAIGYEVARQLLSKLVEEPTRIAIFLVIPFVFRDMVFRNASLGKKILGIVVLDLKWQKPPIRLMLKRAVLENTKGIMHCYKSFFLGEKGITLISYIDWEMSDTKTFVIDKKMKTEIEKEIPASMENREEKMSALYMKRMREAYYKKG